MFSECPVSDGQAVATNCRSGSTTANGLADLVARKLRSKSSSIEADL